MILSPDQRRKLDETADDLFYETPRFVTHVDAVFLEQLSNLYRDRLPAGTRVLDLMSSWVSHLPPELEFEWVEGHGMNAQELQHNPRLNHYFVQDLNLNPKLPLEDATFDAVLNTVSVQYLQYPEAVFSEIARVLKPGGIAIVSFSNRMFFQKAIARWRDASEPERVALVRNYFRATPGFDEPEILAPRPTVAAAALRLLGMGGADPFYAVLARRVEPT